MNFIRIKSTNIANTATITLMIVELHPVKHQLSMYLQTQDLMNYVNIKTFMETVCSLCL